MRIFLLVLLSLFITETISVDAQTDRVRYYLQLVAQGKVDEVKRDLPDLLVDYPDDPGIQLIHAVVIDDISKAVMMYERIVDRYPKSEFADEAYWRIVQFYATKGDTSSAQKVLDMYRAAFPNSVYLVTSSEAIRTAKSLSKTSGKTTVLSLGGKTTKKEPGKTATEKKEPKKIVIEEPAENIEPDIKKEKIKHGSYGLQVGLYSTIDAAKSEVTRFRDMRLKADIITKEINGDEKYAVVIGDYSTRESAEAAKNIVQQQCGCTPLIFEK